MPYAAAAVEEVVSWWLPCRCSLATLLSAHVAEGPAAPDVPLAQVALEVAAVLGAAVATAGEGGAKGAQQWLWDRLLQNSWQ